MGVIKGVLKEELENFIQMKKEYEFKENLDVFKLVEDLGFPEVFQGSKGYMKIEHPDLTIEFLVPEKGRGSDKAYTVPQLKINP